MSQPTKSSPLEDLLQLVNLSNTIQSGQNNTAQLGLEQNRLAQNANQFQQNQALDKTRLDQGAQGLQQALAFHNDALTQDKTKNDLEVYRELYGGDRGMQIPTSSRVKVLTDAAQGNDLTSSLSAIPGQILQNKIAEPVTHLQAFAKANDKKSYDAYLGSLTNDPEAYAEAQKQAPFPVAQPNQKSPLTSVGAGLSSLVNGLQSTTAPSGVTGNFGVPNVGSFGSILSSLLPSFNTGIAVSPAEAAYNKQRAAQQQ